MSKTSIQITLNKYATVGECIRLLDTLKHNHLIEGARVFCNDLRTGECNVKSNNLKQINLEKIRDETKI
jgi:hypothetical protein